MAERFRVAQESGRRIVSMVHEKLTARKIINKKGLENAIRLGMAIGGSTNKMCIRDSVIITAIEGGDVQAAADKAAANVQKLLDEEAKA